MPQTPQAVVQQAASQVAASATAAPGECPSAHEAFFFRLPSPSKARPFLIAGSNFFMSNLFAAAPPSPNGEIVGWRRKQGPSTALNISAISGDAYETSQVVALKEHHRLRHEW